MINTTPYTLQQIRAYIKWVGWKYQPPSHWERKIEEVCFNEDYHPYKHISYDVIVVYGKDGIRDVTIPHDRFRVFLIFHNIQKPKPFKLYGNQ